MPAAPTTMRRRDSRNAEEAEASTYGIGIRTSSMTPISCTSPPQTLTAQAWPNSCSSLSTGKVSQRSSRFSGASTREVTSSVRSFQCVTALTMPMATTTLHTITPAQPNHGRYQGSQRSSDAVRVHQRESASPWARAGSASRSSCARASRAAAARRRRASPRFAGLPPNAAGPSSRITSSCVGASSPKRLLALSHICCTVRRPSSMPMT